MLLCVLRARNQSRIYQSDDKLCLVSNVILHTPLLLTIMMFLSFLSLLSLVDLLHKRRPNEKLSYRKGPARCALSFESCQLRHNYKTVASKKLYQPNNLEA